jgi:hypothetical protein
MLNITEVSGYIDCLQLSYANKTLNTHITTPLAPLALALWRAHTPDVHNQCQSTNTVHSRMPRYLLKALWSRVKPHPHQKARDSCCGQCANSYPLTTPPPQYPGQTAHRAKITHKPTHYHKLPTRWCWQGRTPLCSQPHAHGWVAIAPLLRSMGSYQAIKHSTAQHATPVTLRPRLLQVLVSTATPVACGHKRLRKQLRVSCPSDATGRGLRVLEGTAPGTLNPNGLHPSHR